jgi:hypothetical protein
MKIYKKEMRYDERTGKPKKEEIFADHICCDFTGAKIDPGDAPTIYIDFHNIDQCFGSGGEEYDFGKKHGIYMFDFLDRPYDFANWEVYETFMGLLLKHKNKNFDIALRDIRMKTAQGMLERGQVEPWQLDGRDPVHHLLEDEEDEDEEK